jgi:hypothetical protein
MGASVNYKIWNSINVHAIGRFKIRNSCTISTAETEAPGKKSKSTEQK